MEKYFDKFPLTAYSNSVVIDITKRVKVLDRVFSNPYAFYPFDIGNATNYAFRDGDTYYKMKRDASRYNKGSLSNGCLMKILQGELDEYNYEIKEKELNLLNIRNCKADSIGYQEEESGLHDIVNKDNKTVSLHIYSPPNYKSNKY